MDPIEYARGLRDLADWVEQNADQLEDRELRDDLGQIFVCRLGRDEFVDAVRMLGTGDKTSDDSYFNVTRRFGPVAVQAYTPRATVCQRVVTGVRTVTRQVPDPDAPLVTVTEEVEDVDWVCEPSILKLAEGAV